MLAVRAGFEPEGCLRMMDALGPSQFNDSKASHPDSQTRALKLQALIGSQDTNAIKEEGETALAVSGALAYERFDAKNSLRIGARGKTSSDDLERLFGQ